MKIGILCGHLIKDLFDESETIEVETSFGSVQLQSGLIHDHQVFFLNRHGPDSTIPPHKISYKANIQAFASAKVDAVLSVGTVGSMNEQIRPGDLVIPHDFFDATHSRSVTFFDDARVHVDMTDPFCPYLRKELIASCENNTGRVFHTQGVYVSTPGPRLETAAEIRFYKSIGDIVGMTLVPEVVLAREKGLCFSSLCLVCNMAAGMQQSLTVTEIKEVYARQEPVLAGIIKNTIGNLSVNKQCSCHSRIEDALL